MMHATFDDFGDRKFDADSYDVDQAGFLILTKRGQFVAAIDARRVVTLELKD